MSRDAPGGSPPQRGERLGEDAPTAPLLATSGSSFAPTFSSGELAAGRFRIERFLARGGMGEVYEAHDLQLDTRVALKTLRPSLALDEKLLERFKREVLLARRVTHPNVCRIFDAFQHERELEGPAGKLKERLTFLTMELLSGETLAERLRRTGPIPPAEALPLVEQLAAGLGAAHHVGVVHRDFKSANVTLVPLPGDGVRAVITDFGLAGLHDSGGIDDVAALALGTPAYMAPEQVEGKPATSATDIYAFGIVLYEMLTGTVPFLAPTAVDTAKRRLHETAPSPRSLRPELDPRFEHVMLRCLEREPAARFATVEDLVAALRPPAPQPSRARRIVSWAVAALAVLAVALLPWALVRRGDSPPRYRASQLTTSAGLDLFPAFSPSGLELAYSSDRSGAFEIYVRALGPGAQERALTAGGLQAYQPSWSPDGQQIVFHSRTRGGLWVVSASGGEPRRLTSFGSDPEWSPDGRFIVFQSENIGELAANASPAKAPSTLWLLPADGGEAQRLTQADQPSGGHGTPAWSPDSQRIVFGAYSRLGASAWTVATDGSGLTRVAGERGLFDPVYAADGRHLLYMALERGGNHVAWRVRLGEEGAAEGEPQQLGSFALGTMRHLDVAADGRIAASALSLASNLWSLPLGPDGSTTNAAPKPLTRESGRNSRPTWSPDGTLLAFERWQLGTNPDIWVMRGDGSEARALTVDPAVDTVPSWTPDARHVVFRSEREGKAALWAAPVTGGGARWLRDLPRGADFPRVDPSGRQIAFGMARNGPHNLWLAPLDGGEPTPLSDDPVFMGVPVWSPDGLWIAAQQRRGDDTRVVILPASGGPPRVVTLASGESWHWSFSPDGERLAFGGLREGVWNLFWVAVGSGEERRLTDFDSLTSYVRYPAWSPQGTSLVYELAESAGNVWLLEPE